MPSSPFDSPWPTQTPVAHAHEPAAPIPTPRKRSLKRRRIRDDSFASTSKSARRQVVADQAEVAKALTDCQINSGNNIISCFPTADTVVAQHQWVSFVWNSRRPEITNTESNLVDIFLFHGDSRQQILHYRKVPNPSDQAGRINAQVNDSWWGANGARWNGKNQSFPFYWVLIPSDKTLDGNQIAQPTFTAVQTTYADSVAASMASSSASVASASAASASASLTASSGQLTTLSTSTSTASVQPNSTGKDFPHWAIAVIVVLGFFAIVATCVLAFLIIRRVRRRNADLDSNRNSMGSASPMMANAGNPSSPLLAGAALGGHHAGSIHGGHESRGAARDATSVVMHDGASTISRTGSAANNEGPFSGADAAIMADAFRKMLRKPDFAARPVEEGDSPGSPDHEDGKEEMINRELAEEGRDIRSVSSERGVRVETLSDSGDTVHDRHGRERD
ncbi:hypothetical protein D9615_010002 [Tricholomella constricta]|uniref:Uncharacterized protein n=1 Tax=Tricholomella constricta TaxID=117010 RepID=A0A8H5GTM7_9AGAR|nr:hypothetical protein D9615_010002 [Tricholomella constricta]